MRGQDRARFDIGALRALAGDKVFARGTVYYEDGSVEILAIEPGRVLAQVAGTEDYRTELTGRGKEIDGTCSCPAFLDWGFCKHMVAVAMAANAVRADVGVESLGALSRIRDYLKTKGINALVEMVVDLAERDAALFHKLDMAAAVDHADDKTIETRLRKAIDKATHTRGFIDYREAPGWAADVDAALDTLADLATGPRAGVALRLAERVIERITRAIEEVDDSDGHCGVLLERAGDIHLTAAEAARPEPIGLARDLFAREMEDDYGTFAGAAASYAEVLGDKGLAEYRRLAVEAWAKLPPRCGGAGDRREEADGYHELKGILDFFAERDGDVDARVALRAKDMSSPWSYVQLIEFCLSQGRVEEALRRAEEGLWVFEDGRPDERLVLLAVELLSKAGRSEDAEAHLRRAFETEPSLTLYAELRDLGGAVARGWAVTFLESRLVTAVRTRWHHLADLLIRILMSEALFDPAWAAVRKHGASMGLRESLARASEATHQREALETYAERVDQLAGGGGNPAYAEAAQLIVRMAALRSGAEQATYVAALKARFGRKRNFMQLLG